MEEGRDDFPVGLAQSGVGDGHVVFDFLVEAAESVVGNQGKHVVLHVVVHVPVEIPVYPVHVDRPAIEPVVQDVFGQTRMLGQAIDDHEPGTVEVDQPDEEQGEDAPGRDGQARSPKHR